MAWLTVTKWLCHRWPGICSVCHCHNSVILFLRSWLITGFKTGVTWRVPRAEQDLFILPTLTEHLSWPSVFSWIQFSFVDHCLSFFF